MLSPNFHPSPIKDGRRILSEKSANACLSPSASPIKRSLVGSPPKTQLLPSPSFVAQKRPISQLDDENQENSGIPRVQCVGSRTDARLTNPRAQNETTTRSVLEDKQSDAMGAQQPHQATPLSTRLSQSTTQLEQTQAVATIPEDPQTRKLFIQEKACLLRTRLQNAMRHVRDPQFDRRLSELEAHSRKYPRLSALSLPPSTPSNPAKPEDGDETDEEVTPHTILSISTPRPQFQSSTSTSQPLPVEPTDDDPMKTPTQQSHAQAHPYLATTESGSKPPSPMQLSSPPLSSRVLGSPCAPTTDPVDEGDCTTLSVTETLQRLSPSQRGDAVDGLLKLMNTGEGPGSDTWTG